MKSFFVCIYFGVAFAVNACFGRVDYASPSQWLQDWRTVSGWRKGISFVGQKGFIMGNNELVELDHLGVFPIPNSTITENARKWAADNILYKSKFYLKVIPKSNLQRDKELKKKQDFLEEILDEVREGMEEAYAKYEIYKLPKTKFEKMAKCYKKCVGLRAWKEVGVSKKAFYEILDQMPSMCNLKKEIYGDVLVAQKAWFQELAVKNPAAANAARDRAVISRLKAEVTSARAAADNAIEQASWAQAAANAARNEAAQAHEDAERAKNNANKANARLLDNGIW